MWKEVGTLVYLVAFTVLFFVLWVPGFASEAVKSNVAVSFAFALVSIKMVNVHMRKASEVKSAVLRGVTLAVPFIAAIAVAVFDPRQNQPVNDRLATGVGMYMCAIGLIAASAWLVKRWRGPRDRGDRATADGT